MDFTTTIVTGAAYIGTVVVIMALMFYLEDRALYKRIERAKERRHVPFDIMCMQLCTPDTYLRTIKRALEEGVAAIDIANKYGIPIETVHHIETTGKLPLNPSTTTKLS